MARVLYFDKKDSRTFVEKIGGPDTYVEFERVYAPCYDQYILVFKYDMEVVPQKIRPLLRILYK